MILSQWFAQINANYNTVKGLANSIYTPLRSGIDVNYSLAKYYSDFAIYEMYSSTTNMARDNALAVKYVIYLLKGFLDEMFLSSANLKSILQSIFNTYLAYVVTDVQNAIYQVQYEMYNEVDFLAASVDATILDMQNYLDDEVNAMHTEIDLLSIDVISWIDAAVANLADTLNSRIEEVNTNLTARVNFLETWTQGMFQAIYDYVDIRDAEMMGYIDDLNSTLYVYINSRVKELENYIGVVQNSLNLRITTEVITLTDEISAVEISLTDKINELIKTTGWNFTFFDLFTFKPELSLLRVLLRSEAEFKRYKPYWQALFARILEED